ncbi:MAG: 4-(cytidine 5'-diphospho)-2-C-methyl-D-erythritol kinase, partial [Oscillospiraceae bacterium]|nr:4-(cytidine 5'-diphospho)-2-C-methyl-D-erythritol kinase [Oscillospiraceae bacterium]
AEENSFWCSWEELNNDNNLAVKARDRLAREYSFGPVEIRVEKHIPTMAGLGGGSADCAAVLNGLNKLFELNIPREKLVAIGAELGADIPACIVGGLLQADGIGEQITPLVSGDAFWFNVVKPDVAFSTAEMYRKLGRDNTPRQPRDITPLVQALQRGEEMGVGSNLFNSFEEVAEPKEPILQTRVALLQTGALGVRMTGSGSAVFGVYGDEQTARLACDTLKAQGKEVYCCHSVPAEE